MKKYLALLCTAALLCGCSSNGKSSSTAGNTSADQGTNAAVQETTAYDPYFDTSYEYPITGTDTDMSEIANVDWSLIYRDAIEDFKKSDNFDETARFTVYDINEDRIPELIISYGTEDDTTYLIKSLSDQNVYTEFEPISDGGQMYFSMNRNLPAIFFFNYETNSQIVQLYRLKNSKLANVYTFEITDNIYKMNGQECTEEEYNDEYTLLLSGVIKDMGTDFGFDDDSIDAALGNKASMEEGYAAVLSDYLSQMQYNQNMKSTYSLMDVNGDEVPELFVSVGIAFAPSVSVYSWNGCVVPVGSFGSDGTIGYFPESGELWGEYHAPSYTAGSFYKFNDVFQFEEIFNYGDTEVSDAEEKIYNINAEATPKDEYHKMLDDHTKGDVYQLGADNDVNAENIKLLIEGKYTAPSVKAS